MSDDSHDSSRPRRPRIHRPGEQAWERESFARPKDTGRGGRGFAREESSAPRTSGPRHGVRYRFDLEYLGTRYSGWQFQTNARTVAGEIMEAIHRATGQRVVEIYGSGRTDAGVHAIHQVAHVDLAKEIPPGDLLRGVNDELPGDINLLRVERAPEGFHARHSALSRAYVYRISRRRTAFDKAVVWWVKDPLDVAEMARASKALAGLHDFKAFAHADPSRPDESTKVKVDRVDVTEQGSDIFIRIRGSHFLWKMVRRIVGVLVEVGRGRLRAADVGRILDSSSASIAEYTAPPSGLALEEVAYGSTSMPRDLPAGRVDRELPRQARHSLRPHDAETATDARRGRPHDARGGAAERPSGLRRFPQKPKAGFRPRVERTEEPRGRPEGEWPRRSASREYPPGRDKRTFRRRG